jgi:acyl-CoA reductase-like NAD-dependent aldehyde dehydrogenase
MPEDSHRLDVLKTYKLYIAGAFPRSESGRSEPITIPGSGTPPRVMGHSCLASRKDLRDAVVAARKAQPGWKNASAYNRGQILYRMAEMLEGKRAEFVDLLADQPGASRQSANLAVSAAVDRLVHFAGWTDKIAHVLGCQNPVAGPYWNITVPEPTGVIGVVCPADQPLLALVTLVAPLIAAGNAVVVISPAFAPVVSTFGEVCATSDLPGGVINLLTGSHAELVPVLAKHRDLDGIHAAVGGAGLTPDLAKEVQLGTADNLKRVKLRAGINWNNPAECEGLGWIEPFVEFKTTWHPVGA